MKIFVTGGSGHLGSNLIRRLLEDDHEIVAFALQGANNLGLTEGLEGQKITIKYGDLRDRASIDRAIAGCEVAFHVAAMIVTKPGGE